MTLLTRDLAPMALRACQVAARAARVTVPGISVPVVVGNSRQLLRRRGWRHRRLVDGAVVGVVRLLPAADPLAAPILEDKVVDFILEMANVSDRQVPVAELLAANSEAGDGEGEEDAGAGQGGVGSTSL